MYASWVRSRHYQVDPYRKKREFVPPQELQAILESNRDFINSASSIMSKKLAAGSDSIVLDVKTGSGAFMKTLDESICLAKKMVSIGCMAGRRCCALITNMDIPLGYAIGNSLEMTEAIRTLKGEGPEDLTRVCLELAANMLHLAGRGTVKECRKMAEETIHDAAPLSAWP